MTDNDIKTISEKIDSLHKKILESKFAEKVTESEMVSLILAVQEINRQKTEIDILIRKKETLRDEIEEQQAEIERLREILDKRCDVCPAVITAIKEFAERLKDTICDKVNQSLDNPNGYDYYPIDVYKDIDNLVKETTEQSVNYGSSKITE